MMKVYFCMIGERFYSIWGSDNHSFPIPESNLYIDTFDRLILFDSMALLEQLTMLNPFSLIMDLACSET